MVSMDTLVIKTENKFRSLVTKQAYAKAGSAESLL
jgi:hypothetical protein